MKIEAILVIDNVPSVLQRDRKMGKDYQTFGYPTLVWELVQNDKLDWMHPWDGFAYHYYTTNHAKKIREARKLHRETGLPVIHINKERASILNKLSKTMTIFDALYIPFRKNDLCLK